MSLKINHNLEAMEALRNLSTAQGNFSQSMQRLSSGKRINSAADDAAGYAISNKLMAQSQGLNQAQSNAQDGISMIQTASGGLQTIQNLLQRFRQLAVQSANDTNTSGDRTALQNEANQISQEITQIATTTQFNTKNLLDGTLGTTGEQLSASFTLTGKYNGAALTAGNSPTVNSGNLAATSSTGATNTYTFSLTTAGTAGTITATGTTGTGTAATSYIGDSAAGLKAYNGAGQTQQGVVGGTYNLTITGAKGSATITVTAGATSGDKFQDVVDKINAVSAQTGVSASFDTTNKLGINLTNSVPGSAQAVTATGQDQLLRGLGLLAADGANYTTTNALTASEQKISTATASGTDGVATLSGGQIPAPITLQANGNRFSDAGSGFSFDLNAVQGLTNGTATAFTVSTSGTATLQVGANANQNLTVAISSMTAASLSVGIGNSAIDITSQPSANAAITVIDSAIQTVSNQASTLGAIQNRLTAAMGNLAIGSENMTAAFSAITDVNMAQESTSLATAQILQQSSTAMLAQANQAPQGVLKLLGG